MVLPSWFCSCKSRKLQFCCSVYQYTETSFNSGALRYGGFVTFKRGSLKHKVTIFSIAVWKVDEVTGEWRRLHNEELYNLYSSPTAIRMIKSRRMRWAGRVARMENRRGAYRSLVGRPLGRPRRKWEDNIKINLQEVRWGGMYWIDLAQGRDRWRSVVNAVMNLRVP